MSCFEYSFTQRSNKCNLMDRTFRRKHFVQRQCLYTLYNVNIYCIYTLKLFAFSLGTWSFWTSDLFIFSDFAMLVAQLSVHTQPVWEQTKSGSTTCTRRKLARQKRQHSKAINVFKHTVKVEEQRSCTKPYVFLNNIIQTRLTKISHEICRSDGVKHCWGLHRFKTENRSKIDRCYLTVQNIGQINAWAMGSTRVFQPPVQLCPHRCKAL